MQRRGRRTRLLLLRGRCLRLRMLRLTLRWLWLRLRLLLLLLLLLLSRLLRVILLPSLGVLPRQVHLLLGRLVVGRLTVRLRPCRRRLE